MPVNLDSALGLHATVLSLRAQRAEVLASNLANADTPGFKARDVDFKAALEHALGNEGSLQTTNARHLSEASAAGASASDLKYRIPNQPSLDGNTVDTQTEQAAFAENALQYRASLQFLGGRLRTLLTAIRGE